MQNGNAIAQAELRNVTENGIGTHLHKPTCGTEESTATQLCKPSRRTGRKTETETLPHKLICGSEESTATQSRRPSRVPGRRKETERTGMSKFAARKKAREQMQAESRNGKENGNAAV